MEEVRTLDELIQQTYDWLEKAKYSQGTLNSFKSVTKQLKIYAVKKGESCFSMDLAIEFLEEHYGLADAANLRKVTGLRFMEMLSDIKLNNSVMIKERKREYIFPEAFKAAVDVYNDHRRSINIKEDSVFRSQLYLERFFDFLPALLQIAQVFQPLCQFAKQLVVHGPGLFLAVPGDKGDGVSPVLQVDNILHRLGGLVQFLSDSQRDPVHGLLR